MIDLYSYQNIILLVARLILGVTFIKHGWPKIKKPFGMKEIFAGMKFPAPGAFSVVVSAAEFFGGIAIVAGYQTQTFSLFLAVVMSAAVIIKKFKNKNLWIEGYELELALLALALMIALFGAGDWAFSGY